MKNIFKNLKQQLQQLRLLTETFLELVTLELTHTTFSITLQKLGKIKRKKIKKNQVKKGLSKIEANLCGNQVLEKKI